MSLLDTTRSLEQLKRDQGGGQDEEDRSKALRALKELYRALTQVRPLVITACDVVCFQHNSITLNPHNPSTMNPHYLMTNRTIAI